MENRYTLKQLAEFGVHIAPRHHETGKLILPQTVTKKRNIPKNLSRHERKVRNRKSRNLISDVNRKIALLEIEQFERDTYETHRQRGHNLDHVANRSKAIGKAYTMFRDKTGKSGLSEANLPRQERQNRREQGY